MNIGVAQQRTGFVDFSWMLSVLQHIRTLNMSLENTVIEMIDRQEALEQEIEQLKVDLAETQAGMPSIEHDDTKA